MIGYYVHHVGHGHRHRARALAATLREPIVGLSSAPRPEGWTGGWVPLDGDDAAADPVDPTAHGRLHWVPSHDPGLLSRTAAISAWISGAQPRLMVVDVSVEVTLLARLHGVPVVVVAQPGDRSDAAHRLGYGVADAVVGFWPPLARGLVTGLEPDVASRLRLVGALSRHPVAELRPDQTDGVPADGRRHVVVLAGSGGVDESWTRGLREAEASTPSWRWTVLGGPGAWVDDPSALLAGADVVVTHGGQNALAEVAAARRPAVVVPHQRPHDEQATTGRALARGLWPVLVEADGMPSSGWGERLDRAAGLDGVAWAPWCDGRAAERFAQVVGVFGRQPDRQPGRLDRPA